MRYGAGDTNKLEYAKLLAASLSYMIIRQRDSVGLRIFNTRWVAELPPSSQLGHINAITHTLEDTQPREKTAHRAAARRSRRPHQPPRDRRS